MIAVLAEMAGNLLVCGGIAAVAYGLSPAKRGEK